MSIREEQLCCSRQAAETLPLRLAVGIALLLVTWIGGRALQNALAAVLPLTDVPSMAATRADPPPRDRVLFRADLGRRRSAAGRATDLVLVTRHHPQTELKLAGFVQGRPEAAPIWWSVRAVRHGLIELRLPPEARELGFLLIDIDTQWRASRLVPERQPEKALVAERLRGGRWFYLELERGRKPDVFRVHVERLMGSDVALSSVVVLGEAELASPLSASPPTPPC